MSTFDYFFWTLAGAFTAYLMCEIAYGIGHYHGYCKGVDAMYDAFTAEEGDEP